MLFRSSRLFRSWPLLQTKGRPGHPNFSYFGYPMRSLLARVVAMSLIASPLLAQEGEAAGGSVNLLSPSTGLMAWTLIIFAIVFVVLAKFAFGPITAAVRDREAALESTGPGTLRSMIIDLLAAAQRGERDDLLHLSGPAQHAARGDQRSGHHGVEVGQHRSVRRECGH